MISSSRTLAVLACASTLLVLTPAYGQSHDPGFVLQRDDLDQKLDHDSLNAKDFYKLLDQSIGGKKFANAILIFGGCYTGDFADVAGSSSVGTNENSGPVAVIAASGGADDKKNGEKNRWELCPDISGGNPFVNGVMESFADGNTATTAAQNGTGAMQSAVDKSNLKGAGAKPLTASHPDNTFFHGGGDIKLNADVKGKKYAILMIGDPESYVEWNALVNEYDQLVQAGYTDIDVLFGTGKRDDKTGIPLLPNGKSVEDDEKERRENGEGSAQGVTIKHVVTKPDSTKVDLFLQIRRPATFRNLRADLQAWMKQAAPGDAFFFKAEGHFTNMAHGRTADELDLSKNLAIGPQAQQYWYYCYNPQGGGAPGYYPTVQACSTAWQPVAAATTPPGYAVAPSPTPAAPVLPGIGFGFGFGFGFGRHGGEQHEAPGRSMSAPGGSEGTTAPRPSPSASD